MCKNGSNIFWGVLSLLILFFAACAPPAPPEINEGELLIQESAVFYKTIGSGDPMVIIHGGPVLDHSYFLPQLEALAKDRQLVFYDQRACGKSSVEVDSASMSVAGFVEDIELLRQALELEKIDILGHSWGGLLAMHYAIQYPDHLRSLILSNSIPADTDEGQQEQVLLAKRISPADSLQRQTIIKSGRLQDDPAAAVKDLMLLSFKIQFHDPAMLDSLSLWIPDDYMARSQVFQLLGPDLTSYNLYDDLAKLAIPTLIIYGDQEPAAELSGKRLAQVIPNAELVVIENSGHFPFVEQRDDYLGVVKDFLGRR